MPAPTILLSSTRLPLISLSANSACSAASTRSTLATFVLSYLHGSSTHVRPQQREQSQRSQAAAHTMAVRQPFSYKRFQVKSSSTMTSRTAPSRWKNAIFSRRMRCLAQMPG